MQDLQMYLKLIIKKIIPAKFYPWIWQIYSSLRSFYYIGDKFTCPICSGHFRMLLSFGVKKRQNAKCPKCGSLERHRLLWLYLRDRTNFFTDHLKILDIAPLHYLQEKCKKLENLDYISADISSPIAMTKMDITDIHLPDNQFDCIICYHVLEHINDDKKAMRELFRIIKPGGWAILQVPIDPNLDKTFEDISIIQPDKRENIFGQKDHVRVYGRDYKNRLEEAGFVVKIDDYVHKLKDSKVREYALIANEEIYFCSKPK